jgi:hypothetical protein
MKAVIAAMCSKELAATKRPEFPLFAFNLTVATKCTPWIKLS